MGTLWCWLWEVRCLWPRRFALAAQSGTARSGGTCAALLLAEFRRFGPQVHVEAKNGKALRQEIQISATCATAVMLEWWCCWYLLILHFALVRNMLTQSRLLIDVEQSFRFMWQVRLSSGSQTIRCGSKAERTVGRVSSVRSCAKTYGSCGI